MTETIHMVADKLVVLRVVGVPQCSNCLKETATGDFLYIDGSSIYCQKCYDEMR